MPKNQKPKPGPDPETLDLDGPWEDRVKEALRRKRPKKGWPKPEKPEKQSGKE